MRIVLLALALYGWGCEAGELPGDFARSTPNRDAAAPEAADTDVDVAPVDEGADGMAPAEGPDAGTTMGDGEDAGSGPSTPDASMPADAGSAQADASTMVPDAGGVRDAGQTDPPIDATTPNPPADAIAVAAGFNGSTLRAASSDNWTDFQQRDPDTESSTYFRGIGYGNGTWVAVGGTGDSFSMSSRDGVNWENRDASMPDFMSDVVYLDGRFITAGGNGMRTYSDDGAASWNLVSGSYAGHYRAIASGNGIAVAVGHTYGNATDVGIVSVTSDGATWSDVVEGGPQLWNIDFGNGVFVAAGDGVRRSTDGVQWTDVDLADAQDEVVFANGEFIVRGSGGYHRSSNGVDWTFTAAVDAPEVNGFLHGYYLNLANPPAVLRSADLSSWQTAWSGAQEMNQLAVGVPGAP